MDLQFNEEQEILRETIRSLLEEHAPLSVVREMENDPVGFPRELWKELGELGMLGITIPEEFGGAGLSALDNVVLYEEFGRAITPSPHFVSSLMSANLIARGASREVQSDWLPRIASGDAIVSPAWLEPGGSSGPQGVGLRATVESDGVQLSGSKLYVKFANSADAFVVVARTGDAATDIDLFLVPADSAGIELVALSTMATDVQYEVRFNDVSIGADLRLGESGRGWQAWEDAMTDGIIAQAALASGGATYMLEISTQYAKDRVQFDKPIGAFQSIAHMLADMSTETEAIAVLVRQAAWARSEGNDVRRLAAIAKLTASSVYRSVSARGVQIHGGVGFTTEEDPQLFFRRAKQLELDWWESTFLEERIASLILDE